MLAKAVTSEPTEIRSLWTGALKHNFFEALSENKRLEYALSEILRS